MICVFILLAGTAWEATYLNFIIKKQIIDGTWESLYEDNYNLLIGDILAIQLGVRVGDKVNVLVPDTNLGLAGVLPRTRQFIV